MNQIEVYADVRCPFTHVGLRRMIQHRSEVGGGPRLVIRAWPLELVNDAPLNPVLIAQEIVALRDQVTPDLFGGFDQDSFSSTSMPALALSAAAYRVDLDTGEAMALALRDALFEEGRDIADPAVLAELADRHGVAMVSAGDHQAVLAEWHLGKERGVIGSPHFIVGDDGFFCPGLDISHGDAGFQVRPDDAAFTQFVEQAFQT